MTEFLKLNSPEEFWKTLQEKAVITPRKKERIPFTEGLNRVLAQEVRAPLSLPPFDRSTVDGFAVRSRDTAGASESLPLYLTVKGEVLMGESTGLELGPGEAVRISTGGMVPAGADAVLMVENTEYLDERTIEFTSSVAAGENVVRKGEDISEGELLLEKGHLIRPQDIGALAGLGITEIEVFARPEVAVISTGDELVPPAAQPGPGEIRDINTYAIGAVLEDLGCRVRLVGIVEDSFNRLRKAIKDNLDCDLILISGGSSVGVKDMTVDLLNSLGEPGVLLHGVSVKPGKPTILAVINRLPVIGLPGHPASAWTITSVLVKPLVLSLRGEKALTKDYKTAVFPGVEAILNRNLVSDKGREEYVPVRVRVEGESAGGFRYIAEPVTGKSSLITTLVQADGFIRIDTYQEGVSKGEKVIVHLFRN